MYRNFVSKALALVMCFITASASAAKKPLVFLPFAYGESWYLVQGPGGGYTHGGVELQQSYDWSYLSNVKTFGKFVYSPIKGMVMSIRNDIVDYVDNCCSTANNNSGWGNNIIIYDIVTGKYVRLLHFKKGSIAVKAGDTVNIGTYLGQVGMTGKTTNPHVHLHVQESSSTGLVQTIPIGYIEGPSPAQQWLTSNLTPNASVLDSDGSVNIGHGFGTTSLTKTGTWVTSTWSGFGFTGDDYLYNQYVNTPGKFTWQFTVKETGIYSLYVRWKPQTNRDPKAKYTFLGATTTVNQQSGGDWTYLTQPYLKAGTTYSVFVVGTTPGTYIIADAIMVVKQ